jgi:hypothetical protein
MLPFWPVGIVIAFAIGTDLLVGRDDRPATPDERRAGWKYLAAAPFWPLVVWLAPIKPAEPS